MKQDTHRFAFPRLLVVTLVSALLVGCGPKNPPLLSCEQYYEIGMKQLEDENWLKAQESFQRITLNYPGCDLVDDAQFMLGETYYRQEQFIEAQFEFRRVVEDFRLSDRTEDAQYKMAMCAFKQSLPSGLDQTATQEAIFRFQQYLDDYPRGQFATDARRAILECRKRLAKKDYDSARFYARQGYNDGALIYLDHIINEYPDAGEWLERARFLKAEILAERGQRGEALNLLRSINTETLKPRLQEDIRRTTARLEDGD